MLGRIVNDLVKLADVGVIELFHDSHLGSDIIKGATATRDGLTL